MSDDAARALARSTEELEAARTLADAGHPAPAVSRAYYACFYVAQAAIGELGETRSKHSGMIAAFRRLVVKEGGLDPEAGDVLLWSFESRNEADYHFVTPSPTEAQEAIENAERFVATVREWLNERGDA